MAHNSSMSSPVFVTNARNAAHSFHSLEGGIGRFRVAYSAHSDLIIFFAFALAITQCADGLLTYYGLKLYGQQAEGNRIVLGLCSSLGIGWGLLVSKSFALGCLWFACAFGKRLRWLPSALCALLITHLAFAIGPWTYLLF